jgi:hypothetical protein
VQQAMTVARALEHQAHVAWLVRLRAVAPVPAR